MHSFPEGSDYQEYMIVPIQPSQLCCFVLFLQWDPSKPPQPGGPTRSSPQKSGMFLVPPGQGTFFKGENEGIHSEGGQEGP